MADSGFELGRVREDLAIGAVSADKLAAVVTSRLELGGFDFLIACLAEFGLTASHYNYKY